MCNKKIEETLTKVRVLVVLMFFMMYISIRNRTINVCNSYSDVFWALQ